MSPDHAKEALSLNGQMVLGRPVRLDLSAPKKPGFGGGFGRDRGAPRGGFGGGFNRGPPRGGRGGRGGFGKPASARGSIVDFQGSRKKF